ncbi:MAG: SET domain-containing protein, partial [Asgard group archaeon]|nr:SET domain-containing protein [Asgard group archaeon]
MNHSCEPNCVIKMKTLKITDYFALRDIESGEELTHDYSLT